MDHRILYFYRQQGVDSFKIWQNKLTGKSLGNGFKSQINQWYYNKNEKVNFLYILRKSN